MNQSRYSCKCLVDTPLNLLSHVSSWECTPFISDILKISSLWNPEGIAFKMSLCSLQNSWYALALSAIIDLALFNFKPNDFFYISVVHLPKPVIFSNKLSFSSILKLHKFYDD